MNGQLTEKPVAPEPLGVRHLAQRGEWFVYDSILEKRVSQVYATESAAEAVLATLISRRGIR